MCENFPALVDGTPEQHKPFSTSRIAVNSIDITLNFRNFFQTETLNYLLAQLLKFKGQVLHIVIESSQVEYS